MAWQGLGSPTQLLDPIIFEDILSIFITNAVLRVIQGWCESLYLMIIVYTLSVINLLCYEKIMRNQLKYLLLFPFLISWCMVDIPTFSCSYPWHCFLMENQANNEIRSDPTIYFKTFSCGGMGNHSSYILCQFPKL